MCVGYGVGSSVGRNSWGPLRRPLVYHTLCDDSSGWMWDVDACVGAVQFAERRIAADSVTTWDDVGGNPAVFIAFTNVHLLHNVSAQWLDVDARNV